MKNKISKEELKNYKKEFQLKAQLLIGTLSGYKDNKISCIAKIKEGTNADGEKSLGITSKGTALWINLDKLDNWIIEAISL